MLSLAQSVNEFDPHELLAGVLSAAAEKRGAILENALRVVKRELSLDNSPNADVMLSLVTQLQLAAQSIRLPAQAAELLLMVVLWLRDEGRAKQALEAARLAVEIADQNQAISLKRRALNFLGAVYMNLRNIPAATATYLQGIRIAEQIGDRFGACAVVGNLAAARLEAGLIHEAIVLFRHVLERSEDSAQYDILRRDAYHNLCLSFLFLADLPNATHNMEQAIQLLTEPTNKHQMSQRLVMELTFTKVLVRLGKIVEARCRTQIAAGYALRAGTRIARIQHQLALALCDAAEGHVDIALTRLAAIETEVQPMEFVNFRDFLEVELLCNAFAGRQQYAKHYNKKYLSHMAEYQRKQAVVQIANIKRLLYAAEMQREVGSQVRHGIAKTELFRQNIEALADLAELREESSGEHAGRVGDLTHRLAIAAGVEEKIAATMGAASRLHDIGKLATPDAILLKRGKLTAAERELVQRHTTEGGQLLADVFYTLEATNAGTDEAEALRIAIEIAQHHHEWWDGSGYPRRLAGAAIPLAARITAIADVFDELTHSRPYKEIYSVSEALKVITSLSGRQFEPRLCSAFVEVIRQMPERAMTRIPGSDVESVAEKLMRRMAGSPETERSIAL